MPGTTWQREVLVTLGRPRALAVRTAVPALLAWPLVAGRAPTFWAAMLLTVLVAMVGAVGTGVGVERAHRDGLLERLALVPRPAHCVIGGWVGAAAAVDLCQLAPAMVIVIAVGGGDPAAAIVLVTAVATVLVAVNLLGCLVALVAGGTGEVLVDAGVVLAPLLYLGGLFTGVPHDGWRATAAALDPFAGLHSAFIAALGGTPSLGSGHIAALAAATAAASLLCVRVAARPLLEGACRR